MTRKPKGGQFWFHFWDQFLNEFGWAALRNCREQGAAPAPKKPYFKLQVKVKASVRIKAEVKVKVLMLKG